MGFFNSVLDKIGLKSTGKSMDGFFNKTFIHPWQKVTHSFSDNVAKVNNGIGNAGSGLGAGVNNASRGLGQGVNDASRGLGKGAGKFGEGLGNLGEYIPIIAMGAGALVLVSVLKK